MGKVLGFVADFSTVIRAGSSSVTGVPLAWSNVRNTVSVAWSLVIAIFIEFQNFDVGQDKDKLAEMKQKSGQMGVPVIDIEGKILVGFDKETILKELSL